MDDLTGLTELLRRLGLNININVSATASANASATPSSDQAPASQPSATTPQTTPTTRSDGRSDGRSAASAAAPREEDAAAQLPAGLYQHDGNDGLDGRDIRYYAVWAVPDWPQVRGVHTSYGSAGYYRLAQLFPGKVYKTGCGVAFRRLDSFEEACRVYAQDAHKHGAPCPPQVLRWHTQR